MSRIAEGTARFFREIGWFFNPHLDKGFIHLLYKGDNGEWGCMAYPLEAAERLAFYSVAPVRCPEGRRAEMMEFLHRANHDMVIGNFEMDLSDGEIRYKTSLDVEGVELVPALVRNIVRPNCRMMDAYLPGMMSLIYSGASAAEAIHQVEGGPAPAEDAAPAEE